MFFGISRGEEVFISHTGLRSMRRQRCHYLNPNPDSEAIPSPDHLSISAQKPATPPQSFWKYF